MKTAILASIAVLPLLPDLPVLSAQTIPAAGRVLRADSTPVAGTRVVLHQIGKAVQGPLDSLRTDRHGRFRFGFRPDTSAIYILTAGYAGIEYFSPPVHTNPARPDTAIRIIVYDTSSSVPIALEARHLVITRPGDDGTRSVLDLAVLRNGGRLTRVAPDSSRPSWSGPLPRGTLGLQLSEGDISPDAVSRRNDSLIIVAPIAPGEKPVTVQYLVPSDRAVLELPFGERVSGVNVLAEEKDARVSGGTLALADSQLIEGRSFRRWTGEVPSGDTVRITFPDTRRASQALLAALVGLVVLVLGGTGWYFLARLEPQSPAVSSDELVDAIAALDARYRDRESDTPETEWSAYQTERARLKAQLGTSLAAGRRSQ